MSKVETSRAGRLALRGLLVVVALATLGGMGMVLADGQRTSTDELIERFEVRAEVGARFMASYIQEVTAREAAVARATLAGPVVSPGDFEAAVANFGFPAAVLLDEQGRALQVFPANPAALGQDLAARYDHLRRATAGEVAISGVVPSAVEGVPVVGFAVPFDSVAGRRVFSGALAIADTSLGAAYLANILPLPGARAYLVDAELRTVASSTSPRGDVAEIAEADPVLHRMAGEGPRGSFDGGEGREHFVSVRVDGTGWRLVVAVPETSLLLPIQGAQRWLPWVLFAGLAVSIALVVALLLLRSRAQSRQMAELERVSVTDPLTGLYNRRGFDILAEQALRVAARDNARLMVMFLDLDGLKAINDNEGHAAGNDALRAAAQALRDVLRESDVVARVGGDEFCAVGRVSGENPTPEVALARIEEALRARDIGVAAHLGLSAGVSWFDPAHPRSIEDLVAEADARMYDVKQGHRSRI